MGKLNESEMRGALVLTLLVVLATASLQERYRDRVQDLRKTLAREQNADPPLIVPFYGPDDVAADGSMVGNEVAWIDKAIAARRADPASYPMRLGENPFVIQYAVYNLKHASIAAKLIEAFKAGIVVQVLADAGRVKSRRFHIDEQFEEAGIPFYKDRKLMPAAGQDLKASLFSGVKVSSLMHTKMRIVRFPGTQILLTGSLNPGTESMENDESLLEVSDGYIIDRYAAFFERLLLADKRVNEKAWVNEWKPEAPLNVLFSPSEQGFDIGEKILDWIDEEQEFIFISVFSLNVFSGKRSGRNLIGALRRAHERGVMIWVVTDRKQSDGPSGFGRPVDDMIRAAVPDIVMYEVINDVGMWNAMHLKDAIFGITNVKVLTDTSNWSAAAFGSCYSSSGGVLKKKRSCSKESSAESSLFIDSRFLKDDNKLGFRILRHHLGLLDKYYRQIPVQGTNDPSPDDAWARLTERFGSRLPFQRTTVMVQCKTSVGEYVELRGGLCGERGGCIGTPELSYPNAINGDTVALKQSYRRLSWTFGAAMDWTCDAASSSGPTYINNGYGVSWENDQPRAQGANWWKFLAYIDGAKGDWFEFKVVKTAGIAGRVLQWERDVPAEQLDIFDAQGRPADDEGRPSPGKNHQGRLGYVTRAVFLSAD